MAVYELLHRSHPGDTLPKPGAREVEEHLFAGGVEVVSEAGTGAFHVPKFEAEPQEVTSQLLMAPARRDDIVKKCVAAVQIEYPQPQRNRGGVFHGKPVIEVETDGSGGVGLGQFAGTGRSYLFVMVRKISVFAAN